MDIGEHQKQIYLDGRRRYEAKHGKTIEQIDAELERKLASRRTQVEASSSSADVKMQKIVADYKRKHPDGQRKIETQVGPQQAAMMKLADATVFSEALRQLKAGQAGQAMSPVVEQAHKLPVYRVQGGA